MQRQYRYDNIKAFLIFCVVFGHMIEGSSYDVIKMLYTVIYSFHMPMFVFLSGMFARFDTRRIARRLVLPYVVFQTIYCVFSIRGQHPLAYTTPVWVLWYLLSLILWHLLLPFLDGGAKKQFAVFIGSVLAALLVGYDATVGYWLSFSRTVVFFPFFAAGYYYGHSEALQRAFARVPGRAVVLSGGAAAAVVAFFSRSIDVRWLYGSYGYAALDSSPLYRLLYYLCAAVLCAALLKLFPERQTCISGIGQHTMPVYLLHVIPVLALRSQLFDRVLLSENQLLVAALVFAALIVWVLARDKKCMN